MLKKILNTQYFQKKTKQGDKRKKDKTNRKWLARW